MKGFLFPRLCNNSEFHRWHGQDFFLHILGQNYIMKAYCVWYHPNTIDPRGKKKHLYEAGITPWSSYTASDSSIHNSMATGRFIRFFIKLALPQAAQLSMFFTSYTTSTEMTVHRMTFDERSSNEFLGGGGTIPSNWIG